jgi:hypothetical protein
MRKTRLRAIIIAIALCLLPLFVGSTFARADGIIIYVDGPTGIPETDWVNIQSALDDAMPGDTVQLAAGDYYVHKPLVKDGFSGTLKGAGKDTTNIVVSKASNGDLFLAAHIDAWDGWVEFTIFPGEQFYATTLFYFGNCESIVVSDLTMIMDGEDITEFSYILEEATGDVVYVLEEEWGNNIAYAFIVDIAAGCTTTLERVSIVGANDGTHFQPVSPNHGFYITSALLSEDDNGGTHTARDCDFIGMGSNAYQLTGLRNGEVIVESCVFKDSARGMVPVFCDNMDITVTDSLFENMFHSGVMLVGASGHYADVSHNTMIDSGGIWVYTEPVNPFTYSTYEKCYFSFQHNDINLRQYGEWGGLEVWNNIDDDDWADLVFKSNNIHSEGAWLYGPIFTVNAHGAVITNNKITGSGPAAMYIGVADWVGANDRGLMIIGNNLQNWQVDGGPWAPYWEGIARIWLGYTTSQCTVVEGNNQVNVYDEDDYDPDIYDEDGNVIYNGWGAASWYAGGPAQFTRHWVIIYDPSFPYGFEYFYLPEVQDGTPVTELKHNTIVGVNNMQGNAPGDEIKAAMQLLRNLNLLFRFP